MNRTFKQHYLEDDFFAIYDKDIDLSFLDESIVTIPCILNVISIIWMSGDEYAIDSMDEDLYHSLNTIKEVLCRLYPNTSFEGSLIPKRLVNNLPKVPLKDENNEFALLFSGGLDSTSSALAYHDKKLLLITARGQWDVPLDDDRLWKEREKSFRKFAKRYGHTNAFIRSNYVDFLNWDACEALSSEVNSWRSDTTEGMGMFGLIAPILYSKGYSLARMAASHTWSYPLPDAANPLVDNNLRFADAFTMQHDQFEYARFDKLELIMNLAKQGLVDRPILKVCDGRRVKNCFDNDCAKCIPTALMLTVLGEDLASYGFRGTSDEIIEKAKQYLSGTDKHIFWPLWELQEFRDRLCERGICDERLAWFMELDLKPLLAHMKYQERMLWQNFKDLAPATVEIPNIPTKELR